MTEREEALRRFPPPDPASLIPVVPSLHQYTTMVRQFVDEMEKLLKSNPEEFYRKKKLVEQAIKERERGKINALPDHSLTELRQIKKEIDILYGP
jgi:hypothetical protein